MDIKEKLRDLQYDVASMREEVPKQITKLHDINLNMLKERTKELQEEEVTTVEPEPIIKSHAKVLKKLTRKLHKPFDHKTALVQLNNKIECIAKAKTFVRNYEQQRVDRF